MKKIFSTLLTLVFILSFGSVALANEPTYQDDVSVTIKKDVKITNKETINPKETFTFNIGTGSVKHSEAEAAPAFEPNTFNIVVDAVKNISEDTSIATGKVTIDLPEFENVGVYTYPLTETQGNTAGMTYDGKPYELVISVINNPDYDPVNKPNVSKFRRIITMNSNNKKVDDFVNTYNAGKLKVEKIVTGILGDKYKKFKVDVTFELPKSEVLENKYKTLGQPITYGKDEITNGMFTDGKFTKTIEIAHGESVEFNNIPYEVSYEVKEKNYTEEKEGKYESAKYSLNNTEIEKATNITNTISDKNTEDLVSIENIKLGEVNTGISLDSIPYILILGFAVVGIGALFLRKRENANF